MLALGVWQSLLDGIGWVVARIYDLVPNYGVTIILLTVLIRVVLLPLGIKQIRSMQHMQIIQPKIKQLQTKYKGNRTKQQEEIMKLYKEYGVNPFSGCWPVLLQFPILISMYSVLRQPQHPIHIPENTRLYDVIQLQVPQPILSPDDLPKEPGPTSGTSFLGMNLLCSAKEAGNPDATITDSRSVDGKPVVYPLNCGSSVPDRIPYYVFAALMFGTTYFQQRQMTKATPAGSASQQQQTLMKIMPLMFGVFGIFFPAGLVIYWTTSNAWQIGQQYFMLKSRPTAETLAARAGSSDKKPPKKGFMATMMERAQNERTKRNPEAGPARKGGTPKPGTPPGSGSKPPRNSGSGGGSGGDRKKRPKR
jgi:YidC/Oxa1 family membrane protein insertase